MQEKSRTHLVGRREQLVHNLAMRLCTNFNGIDRIDRSLSEIFTPNRQNSQIAFFYMLVICILRSGCVVREELAFVNRPKPTVGECAGSIPDSTTLVSFVRGVANEMQRDLLSCQK